MRECNCSTFPFRPFEPCHNICIGRILSSAAREELISIFNIDIKLATKVSDINIRYQLHNFLEYKSHIEVEDFDKLEYIFNNISGNVKALKWIKNAFKVHEHEPVEE